MRCASIAFVVSLVAWPIGQACAAQAGADPESLLGATIVDSRIQPSGAFLNIITPGGAASRAGLLGADIVTAMEHKPITDAGTLMRLLATHRAGDRIELMVAHLGAPPSPFAVVLGVDAPPTDRAQVSPGGAPARGSKVRAGSGGPSDGGSPPQAVAAAAQPPASWVLFTDPVEHAFTIEVPAGWQVQGGVRRMSQVEVRYGVEAVSPDGAMTLFFGDNSIPAFIVPNQMLARAGFHEGSDYSPGFGQQMTVARYRDGERFASEWGARRISQSCSNPRRETAQALPEASRGFDRAYAEAGVRSSIRAGEAAFSCSSGGREGVGYVFAATELAQTGSNAAWQVKLVSGYTASAEQSARAAQLLSHVSASFHIDPTWMSNYNQTAAAVSRAVEQSGRAMGEAIAARAQAEQKMSQSITDRYNHAAAAQDRNHQGAVEAARGVLTYRDPDNPDRTYQLDNRASHQWVGPGHTTPVPTDSSTPPFPGARELDVVSSH